VSNKIKFWLTYNGVDIYLIFPKTLWIEANTRIFQDGTKTTGNPYPLVEEIKAINEA
jgi:hypothetical protein